MQAHGLAAQAGPVLQVQQSWACQQAAQDLAQPRQPRQAAALWQQESRAPAAARPSQQVPPAPLHACAAWSVCTCGVQCSRSRAADPALRQPDAAAACTLASCCRAGCARIRGTGSRSDPAACVRGWGPCGPTDPCLELIAHRRQTPNICLSPCCHHPHHLTRPTHRWQPKEGRSSGSEHRSPSPAPAPARRHPEAALSLPRRFQAQAQSQAEPELLGDAAAPAVRAAPFVPRGRGHFAPRGPQFDLSALINGRRVRLPARLADYSSAACAQNALACLFGLVLLQTRPLLLTDPWPPGCRGGQAQTARSQERSHRGTGGKLPRRAPGSGLCQLARPRLVQCSRL